MCQTVKLLTAASIVVALGTMAISCRTTRNTETPFGGERTAALSDGAWSGAQWLTVGGAPTVIGKINDSDNACSAEGASWFVNTFTNEGKIERARWMTTSLGVYDLYVNGLLIGEEVLKPGFTHPLKTRRSFTYDVTGALQRSAGAANTLAVQVTPGWWADRIITQGGHEGMLGHRCAFRGVLEVKYTDGSIRHYVTDPSTWSAAIAGPVVQTGIFEGERYDARRGLPLTGSPDFIRPEVSTEFEGEVVPSAGAEIYLRNDLSLSPVKAYVWRGVSDAGDETYGKVRVLREYTDGNEIMLHPGETLVVDFGQNAAAVPSFVFKADAGTRLTCLPGELLNDGMGAKSRGMDGPEGSVHRLNLRTHEVHFRIEYTFAGTGDYESYTPTHTFLGYRYASITATGDVSFRRLRSIPVTSIAQHLETGSISTGDESVNRLIENIIWGMRSNYLSVPTDCPQRNERQGWTADTQVFAETGTFFANTDAFFHKWMRDMRDTQSSTGSFPGVAPWGCYGDAGSMRLGWADCGIIVPWTVWKQFGDTRIIDENWSAMLRFINHINEVKYDHTALSQENGNYQWADWLSYEPLESCSGRAFSNGPKPETIVYWNYLSACYWAMDASMMADMAAATGHDAAPFLQMAAEAKAYLKEQFLTADGTFKCEILNTMQTPPLFALRNGLVSGAAKEAMKARLRLNFKEHGGCLQTGFLGTSILMSTLTDNGMVDLAYDLLFQRKNPSWLYSVDQGATTIWERWNSYMKDKGMGPQGMNSFNHYAYGCVGQWLWQTAAGIAADRSQPGFRHIIMRPVPDRRLGHLDAEYRSAAGLIKSSWRYDGDRWTWRFTIPKGTTASVRLPGESEEHEYSAGTYKIVR